MQHCFLYLILLFVLWNYTQGINVDQLYDAYVVKRQEFLCTVDLCHPNNNGSTDTMVHHFECCDGCSCQPDCVLYNTCCPDYRRENESVSVSKSNEQAEELPRPIYSCIFPSIFRSSKTFFTGSYWMISKCPKAFKDKSVVYKCERQEDTDEKDELIPVHGKGRWLGSTYRNKFCAECNHVNETEDWNAHLKCISTVLSGVRTESVIQSVRDTPGCSISFSPTLQHQKFVSTCKQTYTKCNETGQWEKYDQFIEEACLAYRAVYGYKYNNIFCYICNSNGKPISSGCPLPDVELSDYVTFSALLDFRPKTNIVRKILTNKCPSDHFYDTLKDKCRRLICPEMTTLEAENNTCSPLYQHTHGICYETCLTLLTTFNPETWHLDMTNITHTAIIEKDILNVLKDGILDLNTAEITIQLPDFLFFWPVTIPPAPKWDENLSRKEPYYSVVCLKFLDNREAVERILNVHRTEVNVTLGDEIVPLNVRVTRMRYESGYPVSVFNHTLFPPSFHKVIPNCEEHNRYYVGPLSTCLAIELSSDDYLWHYNESELIIPELNWTIENSDFELSVNGSKVKVCLSEYKTMIGNRTDNLNSLPVTSDPSVYILSLVCTSLSMVSLVITLATYSLFSELRTQPGLNNMALAVSLLIAQGLFQFAGDKTQNEIFCEIVGGLVHFFILLALFWMNVSCFHMFRVFRHITEMQNRNTRSYNKTMLSYVAYTTVMSLTLVSINIGVSVGLSEGKDTGYGGPDNICYISRHYMILGTVTIPALIIITANIGMFLLVICTIYRLPSVSSDTVKNRQYFAIYVKLSTLTGLSYVLAIPLFLAYNIILEYIYIILNACQGVFMMFAFVCNRRVLYLYKNKLNMASGKHIVSSTETKTSTTKTAHTKKLSGLGSVQFSNIEGNLEITDEHNNHGLETNVATVETHRLT